MEKNHYRVVGMMSGTSLDGVDLVAANFHWNAGWTFSVEAAVTIPYTLEWKRRLQQGMYLQGEDLVELDKDYTELLGVLIEEFIEENVKHDLDAVCVHGHTIHHQPWKAYTYQIGNLPVLAERLGQTVVCDFRVPDVALGGQGAPLVPIGDALLFPQYDYCLNLGGFANISTQKNESGTRVAWDICAVNTVLNHYASRLGMDYDDQGLMARSGTLHLPLLDALNGLPFFKTPPPKSLGAEWVEGELWPLIDRYELKPEDVLNTFTEHIAIQLAGDMPRGSRVLVTGGGAFNTYLLERAEALSGAKLEIPDAGLVSFKEAIIFAFLGILRLRNEVNILKSVTGCSHDHSSGMVYQPK